MKLKKPKFWDYKKPNFLSNILLPFSKLFQLISKLKIKKTESFQKIKTICVGNIYLGGTGKTTLAIELKKILDKKKIKSCFIKKDYLDQTDEKALLEKYGKIFVNKDRVQALKKAILEEYQVAIFDDGLQDKSIEYDLSMICFNQKNMIGNGRIIPSGPLRESLNILRKNKNIFLIGNNENNTKFKEVLSNESKELEFYECIYEPFNLQNFNLKESYIAFSGIGNHETFIDMLKKNQFRIIKDYEYPDHYDYNKKDIQKLRDIANKLNAKMITTNKDFQRINKTFRKNILFIDVSLKINQIDKLIEKLNFINESN